MEMPDMSQFGGDMSQFGDGSTFPDMGNLQIPEDFQGGDISWGDMFGGNSSSDDTESGDDASSSEDKTQSGDNSGTDRSERPSGSSSGFNWSSMSGSSSSSGSTSATTLVLLGISVLVLAGGLAFAILYGRKRY